ncbi:DUF1266 domain-containing protein [Burkholderia cenocepacia]|uniref:DUF1266 domain-containing protein n=1 Tax=Burkholderia cepacia complex TaxID=87882 RepID=UPI000F5859B6|nr:MULTISPECIES: DUF1266 domain-containing protein [Burkholderia cepacia complex]ELW9448724.1 DUF1266 domain-containing protein [Burkholderia cenocepacia]ELW9451728.1 DUF1266 domain-containing protein [Burkholderia cenocepacia]MBR8485045.1 DUF1266 domain-containing protein [Burkholderia cenocepacia]MDN7470382.1 DUF1266 domain-containing protein [Burkholderia orbicola]MDN7501765.1 DUF1266 domain-containing protein [Burkholderia orbicola]
MLKLLLGAAVLWLVWYVWRSFRVAARMVREVDADQAAGADSAVPVRQTTAVRLAHAQAEQAPPNRRRWALALADILLIRNGLRCDCDDLVYALPDSQREQLARQVRRELDLPADLPEWQIVQRVPSILAGWIRGVGRSHDGFYEQLAALGRVRDALAFDCARTAFLVRCIALLGWASEQHAWVVLLLNAQRAQDSFDSWEDFGLAYARARQQWLRGSGQDGPASSRATQEVREYLRNPSGNWLALPWKRYRIFDPQPVSS